jgi:hypothetical protein
MPTETTIVVTAIVVIFLMFAGTLVWADLRTRNLQRSEERE